MASILINQVESHVD